MSELYPVTDTFVKKQGVLYPVTNLFVKKTVEEPVVDFAFVIYGNQYITDIPTTEALNFTIDWGDGTQTAVNRGSAPSRFRVTHTYPSEQEWTITIKDYVSGWIDLEHTDDRSGNITKVLTPFPKSETRTSFANCFRGCESLTSIPENLFANNPNATDFEGCFNRCSFLINIPKDLFKNVFWATSFRTCFINCTSLTSIPESLFANNSKATDFRGCFESCTSLTLIPENLFANNPNATDFALCFDNCTSLTSIPENLFANNPNATYFNVCFRSCTSLTSIPKNLFANNPNATSFAASFKYCRNLQNINIKLHTDVLARDTLYGDMFYVTYASDSPQGLAPELWKSATTTASYKTGCFRNNTALTNYADIPAEWK